MPFTKYQAIKRAKELVEDISKKISINQAYLFGSYAKGRPNQWSDLDIALVSNQFKGIRFYDYKSILPYLRGCPNYFEIHPFKKKDFNSKNLFVKEIINNGIKLTP
ncbi:MAG: nucleotidyltransferase domain-containing protein [Candidatus Margulisiibacteriota bacterium]